VCGSLDPVSGGAEFCFFPGIHLAGRLVICGALLGFLGRAGTRINRRAKVGGRAFRSGIWAWAAAGPPRQWRRGRGDAGTKGGGIVAGGKLSDRLRPRSRGGAGGLALLLIGRRGDTMRETDVRSRRRVWVGTW